MTIRWNCKQKRQCYVKNLPDWAMFNGCFDDTTVGGSDIDGFIYQNGACLFLEKKFPGGVLEPPQVRGFDCLARQGNSVITIWCEKPDGSDTTFMRIWNIPSYQERIRIKASLADVRGAARKWWNLHYVGKMK